MIPVAVYSRHKMDVVRGRIFGSNLNWLPHHNTQYVRPEYAARLGQDDWLFRDWIGASLRAALHIDEGVRKTTVRLYDIIFQIEGRLVHPGAHGVLRHGDPNALRPDSLETYF